MTTQSPSPDDPAPARPVRALPLVLVAVPLLGATGVWVGPEGPARDLAVAVLLTAVLALVAVWSWRAAGSGARGGAGRWVAAALLLEAAGTVVRTLVGAPRDAPAAPSLADVLSLAVHPLLCVALVQHVRASSPRFGARMWLDGLIGATGAAALTIALLVGPALADLPGDALPYALHLARPVAAVLLVALLAGVGGALGLRSDRGLATLAAGLLLHGLGALVHLDPRATDRSVEGGVLVVVALLGVALMARGVQPGGHPADVRPAPADRPSGARDLVESRVLAVPVVCGVASVGLLAAGWGERLPVSVAGCAVGCLVAVIVRTAVTFRELHRLRDVSREARTDELTGLANRRALLECARDVVATATPERPMALLLMDLDGFKEVNDHLGHGAGDELLRQIGARMHAVLRPSDTLARLGGDEFAVVLPEAGADAARGVAVRLREVLLDPFTVEGVRLRAGISVGVATGPVVAPTVDALLRDADAAMYVAKDLDAGVHVHADAAVGGHGHRQPSRDDLRVALADGDLAVHLRPQMSLVDGRTVAVHALVRWEHPRHGMLGPHELRPVAERAGLQGRLAEAVLDLALAGAARWWSHRSPLPVAVDVAAANLGDVDLPAKVGAALTRHRLPPRALQIRVVEDALAGTPEPRGIVAELRTLGVAVSVDRYGAGSGCLNTLRHLPVDELALDPALVADVATDVRAAAVVRHTAALAHALGLRVVADGVDDTGTLGALAGLGCDAVEGRVVAPAVPVEALLRWLDDRPADSAVGAGAVPFVPRPVAVLAG